MKLNKFSTVIFFVFAACFFSVSCSKNNSSTSEKIDLSEGWEYSLEKPVFLGGASDHFYKMDDALLKNLERLVPHEYGTVWLKKTFLLPESLKGEDVACYLGRITLADRTYLNGSLIGHKGKFPPNGFTAWNTARFYEIPEAILNENGENELVVEVFVNGEGSIVSSPFIGVSDKAQISAEREQFWNSKINAIFAFLMIILAAYHFMIWCQIRHEKENLWFAFINLITAMYMSVFYISELPGCPKGWIPFVWYQKIFSSGMPFLLPFLIQEFINSFFKRKEPHWAVEVARAVFVVVPIVLVFAAPDYIHVRHMRSWLNPLIIPPIAYIIFTIAYSVFKKRKDSIPLLIGFSPLMITSLLDVLLHDILHLYFLPYFSSMGWQLVIIALLFVLARRFARSRVEAEYLNVHLQDEVDERTKELTESNSQLSAANDKLEQARIMAEKDMKLAVFVQQSFYPRRAPVLDGWEIAYTFQPMSGVSGDLYDFFTTGKKLNGIALFDVSGHGIASGLVTMLSKTIIANNFNSSENLNLATVMKNINNGIVDAKGDIENYLTGLLLRVEGNVVKYVNAGHPRTFLRVAKTGNAFPLELKNTSDENVAGSGALVGIPGMDLDVRALQVEANSGDAFIMYTDCLYESRNAAGEEFGQDAVQKVFAASGNGSAEDKLNYVLNAFKNYTSGVDLKDDLTVIILQKK